MRSVKRRLERLEKEQRFQQWFKRSDLLERFTDDELKTYAETGELPESVLCATYADRAEQLGRAGPQNPSPDVGGERALVWRSERRRADVLRRARLLA